jgi:two-component system cell cycle sensor histidine kinase PleC
VQRARQFMSVTDKTLVSDKDFRELFMKSPVGRMVVSVEPDGSCAYAEANAAAAAYFDIPRERMLGRTPAELFEGKGAEQMEHAFQLCLKSKKMTTFNLLPRFPGGVRVQSFILNPLPDAAGHIRFIEVMIRPDMADSMHLQHERDDALMLMTSLFDASGMSIMVTDHHGRIVRVNDKFLQDYGWVREDLLGEEFTIAIPPEDHAVSRRLHAAFIDHGRQGSREIQVLRKEGSVADVIITTALLELSQKRRFMVSTIRDITERKQLMNSMKRAKEEADSANRAKSAFLANMSHELRTPLNAIIGFSELMKNHLFGPLNNPKYEEYMADIHFSSRHLLDIINDVLDMSKIEAGRVELIESEVAIGEVLDSVARIMNDRAQAQSIGLDFRADKDLPHIKADQRLLRQILINLVSNGVKFSPAGKSVKVRAAVLPDHHMRITVEDEGCGIPADKLKVVLEPFGQVNDPRHSSGQGTGLGLPLAKAMTELHGGKLTIESKEGKGTKVHIDFPLERTMDVSFPVSVF